MYSTAEALNTEDAKEKLSGDVKFYFADQKHGKVIKDFGEFESNKKTNAFNKSDKGACEWVFLSSMISFQERAKSEGGNAVIGITSYYKKHEVKSMTQFECGAGNIMAGVTFKGRVVKLAK